MGLLKHETAEIKAGIDAVQTYVAQEIISRHGTGVQLPDDPQSTAIEALTGLLGGLLARVSALEARIPVS